MAVNTWTCPGCNKEFKERGRSKLKVQYIPIFYTVCPGQKPDVSASEICARCWRIFWQELKTYNPWLEGGMPF